MTIKKWTRDIERRESIIAKQIRQQKRKAAKQLAAGKKPTNGYTGEERI